MGSVSDGWNGPEPAVSGPDRESLLVNFVYAHPVGHAIEALHYCHGYHRAEPSRRIGLVLNAAMPTELAAQCPFVERTYPVRLDLFHAGGPVDVGQQVAAIPRTWDWVVEDARAQLPEQRGFFPGLAAYYDRCREHFVTRHTGAAGASPPTYRQGEQFRLPLPEDARQRAAERLAAGGDGWPRIAVLPGGSGPRQNYPSLASWELILAAIRRRLPDAVYCLVGKLAADERTRTTFDRYELDRLAAAPGTVGVVDVPLLDQLAAISACDVFVSPHSGLGMAALAVGTPWLSLSGNRWPEYYFNGVPFYSVLPDRDRFPCYNLLAADPEPVDDDGPRSPSMSQPRIRADLPEIVHGADLLAHRRWTFEAAMSDHIARLLHLYRGDAGQIWSVDNAHVPYVRAATGSP